MSDSLEKLHSRILSEGRLKADEITRDAKAEAEQILEEAKVRAKRESSEIIEKANLEAEAVRKSILSAKVRANRLRLLDEKNRIVQDILRSVEERLGGISGSKRFDETALRFAAEAVKAVDSERPVVRLGFRAASKKDLENVSRMLPKDSKLVVEEDPVDGLGGVVASDADGRVIFNNTFKSRMERLDSRLLKLISATIFNE